MAEKFCKRVDTGVVYVFSEHLMKRGDMVVCGPDGRESSETKAETIKIVKDEKAGKYKAPAIVVPIEPAKEK